MDPRLTFRVVTHFRDCEPGAIITQDDCPDADFPWLLKVGTIVPVTAGSLPLMSTGVNTSELLDEVENLTAQSGPLKEHNAALVSHIKGMHETTKAALHLAQDRARSWAAAVEENGHLLAQCEMSKRRVREARDELARVQGELMKERDKKIVQSSLSQPSPAMAPTSAPSQAVGEKPAEAAGPAQPPNVIPATGETEAAGKPPKGKK